MAPSLQHSRSRSLLRPLSTRASLLALAGWKCLMSKSRSRSAGAPEGHRLGLSSGSEPGFWSADHSRGLPQEGQVSDHQHRAVPRATPLGFGRRKARGWWSAPPPCARHQALTPTRGKPWDGGSDGSIHCHLAKAICLFSLPAGCPSPFPWFK